MKTYDNPMALLLDYRPDAIKELTQDEQESLRCVCDFESMFFAVTDENIVLTVDGINYDILGCDTLDEFTTYSIEWAKD